MVRPQSLKVATLFHSRQTSCLHNNTLCIKPVMRCTALQVRRNDHAGTFVKLAEQVKQ